MCKATPARLHSTASRNVMDYRPCCWRGSGCGTNRRWRWTGLRGRISPEGTSTGRPIRTYRLASAVVLYSRAHGMKAARTHARPPPLDGPALTRQRAVDCEGWRRRCDGRPSSLEVAMSSRWTRGVSDPRRRDFGWLVHVEPYICTPEK